MPTKLRSQLGMEDVVIDDAELSQLLEDREEKRAALSDYNAIDKKVKAKIESMEQQPPYRIDRFIITKAKTAPKSVAFETAEGSRISIKLMGED